MKLRTKAAMSSENPTPKKSSKKLVVIAAAAVVLIAGGGGGAYFYLQKQQHAEDAGHETAKRKAPAKSIFTPLENFTVNLRDDGGEHYAQIGVTLEVEDAAIETDLKARLPALRNNILLLIASKRSDELLTLEGKQQLAKQIGVRAAQSIGIEITDADLEEGQGTKGTKSKVVNPIKDVLFSQFLVQ